MDAQLSLQAIALSAVGVTIAGLLGGVGFLLRQYTEQRRLARRALFNLLNIWEITRALATRPDVLADEAFDDYRIAAEEIFRPHIKEPIDWTTIDVRALVKPLLVKMLIDNRPSIGENLIDSYRKSVEMLADRYPLLAYRLAGRERVSDLFRSLEEYEKESSQLLLHDQPEAEFQAVIERAQLLTREHAKQDILGPLEEDVIAVAWKAGPINWFRCKRLVRNVRNHTAMNAKDRAEIQQKLKQLLRELVPHANEKLPASS